MERITKSLERIAQALDTIEAAGARPAQAVASERDQKLRQVVTEIINEFNQLLSSAENPSACPATATDSPAPDSSAPDSEKTGESHG